MNFLIATLLVLGSEHLLDGVEDDGAVGEEKSATGSDFPIKHEQFLFRAEFAVISLCGFFEVFLVFGKRFLVRESYAIYSLQ